MTTVKSVATILKAQHDEDANMLGVYLQESLNEVFNRAVEEGVKYVNRAEYDGVNEPGAFLAVASIAREMGIDQGSINDAISIKLKGV